MSLCSALWRVLRMRAIRVRVRRRRFEPRHWRARRCERRLSWARCYGGVLGFAMCSTVLSVARWVMPRSPRMLARGWAGRGDGFRAREAHPVSIGSVSGDGDKTWVRICSPCGRGQLIAHPRSPPERAAATSSFIWAMSTTPGTSVSPTTKAGVPPMLSCRASARTSPR